MFASWQANEQELCRRLFEIEREAHAFPWSESVFNSCFDSRYFRSYLTENDQPVGYFIGEQVLDEVTLMNICVDPNYQGKGFGQVLLREFIRTAQHQNASVIYLEVRESNTAAIALYRKNAFTIVGHRKNYYPALEGREDAVIMTRTF